MAEEYFFAIESFYGYPRKQFDLLAGEYTISHSFYTDDMYTISVDNKNIGNQFTRDDIRDFLFPCVDPLIIESFDGYRSLFMPIAEKSSIYIQRATREYIKKLKWRRIGIAVMEKLSPILYHPKSPYIKRMIASY